MSTPDVHNIRTSRDNGTATQVLRTSLWRSGTKSLLDLAYTSLIEDSYHRILAVEMPDGERPLPADHGVGHHAKAPIITGLQGGMTRKAIKSV